MREDERQPAQLVGKARKIPYQGQTVLNGVLQLLFEQSVTPIQQSGKIAVPHYMLFGTLLNIIREII